MMIAALNPGGRFWPDPIADIAIVYVVLSLAAGFVTSGARDNPIKRAMKRAIERAHDPANCNIVDRIIRAVDRVIDHTVKRASVGGILINFSIPGLIFTTLYNLLDRADVFGRGLVLGCSVSLAMTMVGVLLTRRLINRRSIKCPPGGWLMKLVCCVCRRATSDLVAQMVADMRVEYFPVLKEGHRWKARWIKVLHYIAMARALSVDRLLAAVFNYVVGTISRR